MKLTNHLRDAFIRQAMNDVPNIDYAEQIRKAVMDDTIDTLPPKIKAIWKDAALREWIKTDWNNFGGVSVTTPAISRAGVKLSPGAATLVDELKALNDAQKKQRKELEDKLRGCAYSVTTRKQLAELLPEFVRYMPKDEAAAIRTLPAVANVVADFVKAGWPKDKRETAAA